MCVHHVPAGTRLASLEESEALWVLFEAILVLVATSLVDRCEGCRGRNCLRTSHEDMLEALERPHRTILQAEKLWNI